MIPFSFFFLILDFLFCTLIGTCDALSLVSNKGWEDNSSLQSFLGQINSFREADSSTGETQLGLIKCSKFHCDACKRWSGGCDKSKVNFGTFPVKESLLTQRQFKVIYIMH